jgi:hypothetical protein
MNACRRGCRYLLVVILFLLQLSGAVVPETIIRRVSNALASALISINSFNIPSAYASGGPALISGADLYSTTPVDVTLPSSALQATKNAKQSKPEITLAMLKDAWDRVLTLKAYLDEAERDLLTKNWKNLQVYLYTFSEQENAFAALVEGLFPTKDPIDKAAKEALSFQGQFIDIKNILYSKCQFNGLSLDTLTQPSRPSCGWMNCVNLQRTRTTTELGEHMQNFCCPMIAS